MQKYFAESYLPATRVAPAVTTLPEGRAYYAYLVRHFTTTNLTPHQVHDLGMARVAEIRAQMLDLIKKTGFHGGIPEFLRYLRTDPKFYYHNGDDLLAAYKAQAKTIDPLLVKEFGHLPRIPWGISVIPADQAPNTFPAYSNPPSADGSRAALMAVNLYKPETRPKYEIPVLTCHEGRPGHALQLSLATELTELPKFRRFGYYNAYGEGWGLYAETLCKEMGPLLRSVCGIRRAVVPDVARAAPRCGHRNRFLRHESEEAVQMFKDNTALTDQNIGTEVDSYIVWPGQALSYMIGEIKIQELRKRAEDKLGSKFDIRGFHDAVLKMAACRSTYSRRSSTVGSRRNIRRSKPTILCAAPSPRYARRGR